MQTILRVVTLASFIFMATLAQAQAQAPSEAVAAITKVGGTVKVDENAAGKPVVEVELVKGRITDDTLASLARSLARLPQLRTLTIVSPNVTDAGLKHLAALRSLTELRLNCSVTGTGLKDLEAMPNLQALDFICSFELTNEGLANVKGLAHLRTLRLLGAPKVTEAALADLSGLGSLSELNLSYTGVSDAGLARLKAITTLRVLKLKPMVNAKYTDQRINELQLALPDCKITR